ncbi:uncharacterized protein LOC111052897 [Nilaparvata lugens]|uniref:uncharacterized protein LOC111052897 n=1 Tax=Nilaparvata lugens TaxID=108931 RepID=UPI00193CCD6A|nr:uncharacterized protein LOC111052897 [Nilaparvata lugens]
MRVGETYEEVIGTLDERLRCERLPDEDYKDEYNPKTYFYNTQLIPDFPYTFIHKQVWNCTQASKTVR